VLFDFVSHSALDLKVLFFSLAESAGQLLDRLSLFSCRGRGDLHSCVSLPSRRSDGPGFRLVLKFLSPHQVFRLPLKFQARILLFCFLVLLSALVFGLVFISRVLSFPVRRSTGVVPAEDHAMDPVPVLLFTFC
jgi:hypothetical protein